MSAELTIVIPAHNAATTIGEQLSALGRQQWDGEWEILVVENGSSDETARVVEDHVGDLGDRLRLVRSRETGASRARNVGAAEARSAHLAFVDADDVVGDDWLAAMGNALRARPFVTGPLELSRLNPAWVAASRGRASERRAPTFYGIFPYAHGCNLGIHRQHWDDVGGLDESMTATEDIELSLRMWLAGFPAAFEPGALVHYRYRTTASELWRQGLSYGRFRPLVARRLLEAGQPRPPRLAGWRSWVHLLTELPRAASHEGRAVVAWSAGNRFGHVVGSIQQRTTLL